MRTKAIRDVATLSNFSRSIHTSSNAYISERTASERTRSSASNSNEGISKKLQGRAIAVKDNICTVDFPTTCASNILRDFKSPYDATVVRLLKEHGATICGKTNMDEFGMGSHSTHSAFGTVLNEIEGESFSAGGSSGGSAMAVASGQCWAAIGTDTGGSVRLPAAYTGVFGFKPSYGLISRFGVIAYANSLDTVGILADSTFKVHDIFSVLSEYDPNDPTSVPQSIRERIFSNESRYLNKSALRVGIPVDYNVSELDPRILSAWKYILYNLQKQGHILRPVSLPTTKMALSAYYILAPAEASSNLAKYDGIRYGQRASGSDAAGGVLYSKTRAQGFGPEVKRRILLGSYTLSAEAMDSYFIKAQKIRRLVQREFDSVFAASNPLTDSNANSEDGVDVLICPTAASLPPKLSEVESLEPIQNYVADVFTVPASLTGLPALSIPLVLERKASTAENIGVQVIGQYGMDSMVLEIGKTFEDLGLASKPAASWSQSHNLTTGEESPSLKWPKDLAKAYVNMSRYYGGGMAAIHHKIEHNRPLPPIQLI